MNKETKERKTNIIEVLVYRKDAIVALFLALFHATFDTDDNCSVCNDPVADDDDSSLPANTMP